MYILRCGDGSYYCGIAVDIQSRLEKHRAGKGAKYTKGRLPLSLVYEELVGSRSEALIREWAIKQMNRAEKEKLISCSKI